VEKIEKFEKPQAWGREEMTCNEKRAKTRPVPVQKRKKVEKKNQPENYDELQVVPGGEQGGCSKGGGGSTIPGKNRVQGNRGGKKVSPKKREKKNHKGKGEKRKKIH